MKELINILKAEELDKEFCMNDKVLWGYIYGCWKIWISNKINIKLKSNIIYEIKSLNQKNIEGEICEIGDDSFGNYFIIGIIGGEMCEVSAPGTFPSITIPNGKVTITEVFHPNYIKGGKDFIGDITGRSQGIEVCIVDFHKKDNKVTLKLTKGNLGDKCITLELGEVYKQEYSGDECTGLEYFKDGEIKKFYIRKDEGDGYKVILEEKFFTTESEVPIYYIDKNSDPQKVEKDLAELSKTCNPVYKLQKKVGVIYCREIKGKKSNYFLDTLKDKGITYTSFSKNNGHENIRKFKEEWYKKIIGDTNVEDAYIEQYWWHVFSFDRLPCHVGKEAEEMFDNINKKSIFIFFEGENRGFFMKNADKLKSEDIQIYNDIYVTAEDFSWTYVWTHEEYWIGPFFYENKR